MNIIFGDAVKELPEHYIILELDTFRIPDSDRTETAYCLVETLAINEFSTLDTYKKIHSDLLQAYRAQNWKYCEDAIEGLMGQWNGELNTFYADLLQRIEQYKNTALPQYWDGVRIKT
jgi:hypothetical protein